MKRQVQKQPLRERYRMLVSLLIIPLGAIITARALMFGLQAWMLILLGLAFMGLGAVRLWSSIQNKPAHGSSTHRGK